MNPFSCSRVITSEGAKRLVTYNVNAMDRTIKKRNLADLLR
jgi:hypothetical protein